MELVRSEVFIALTMKNGVFWDVAPCRSCVNRRFVGTYRLHLQGREICERGGSVRKWLQKLISAYDVRRLKNAHYKSKLKIIHGRHGSCYAYILYI
jgi:hypothetical protein